MHLLEPVQLFGQLPLPFLPISLLRVFSHRFARPLGFEQDAPSMLAAPFRPTVENVVHTDYQGQRQRPCTVRWKARDASPPHRAGIEEAAWEFVTFLALHPSRLEEELDRELERLRRDLAGVGRQGLLD